MEQKIIEFKNVSIDEINEKITAWNNRGFTVRKITPCVIENDIILYILLQKG